MANDKTTKAATLDDVVAALAVIGAKLDELNQNIAALIAVEKEMMKTHVCEWHK